MLLDDPVRGPGAPWSPWRVSTVAMTMADDTKRTVESYVDSAIKARADESARALSELRDSLLAAAGRLEEKIRASGEAPLSLPDDLFHQPSAAPEGGVVTHILSAQSELLGATEQVGLLTHLLLACTVSCPRVAFFIVRKDVFAGWAARGFEAAQDADVRNLSIGLAEDTILGAALRSGGAVRASAGQHHDQIFLSRLGGAEPAEAIAVPIWIRDKVAAVLYGDSGQDEAITYPEIPQILGLHAGLCLETLAVRQKGPRPRPGAAATTASGPQAAVPGTISGSVPAISESGPRPARTAPPELSTLSGVPPAPPPSVPPGVPAPAAAARPAPAAGALLESLPEAERKLHEEAKRFARLLVSEIVLYNERQVEEGRRNKDIYERLKDDIDRSLAMYEQRVSSKVRSQSNYFYQELVRTLANGDESAIKVPWA